MQLLPRQRLSQPVSRAKTTNGSRVMRPLLVPRAGLAEQGPAVPSSSSSSSSSPGTTAVVTPEACAMQILSLWQQRDLEGLVPYMSEIAVVKAVVRQHHAKLAEQKQREKQRELQQQQQQQQAQQFSSNSYSGVYGPSGLYGSITSNSSNSSSSGGGGGLATYEPGSSSGSTYASYDAITPFEAQYSVQHWGAQVQPPRPPCPVPGVEMGGPNYIEDYETFNYAHRYGYPPSPFFPPGGGGAGAGGSGVVQHAGPHPSPYYSGAPRPHQHNRNSAGAAAVPEFLAVLDAVQAGSESHHLLDSFAMRHLVLSRPAHLEPLSGMRLSPELFMLRVRSTSLWGEKCVLTFTLKKRSEQEQMSTYSKHPHKEPWVLSKVVGEPLSFDPLEAISPEHPPETIVAAQVQALRECDFDVAYALTSPVGRAVAGTRDRFRAALQGDFRYQPVLMHERATSIHRTHSNANTYLEVFDVQGHPGAGSSLFIWVATRQFEGLYKNCWMVEYVTPIKDPSVIKALKIDI